MQIKNMKLIKNLNPKHLAEEANQGFVDMAQFMMRLATWDRPFWRSEQRMEPEEEREVKQVETQDKYAKSRVSRTISRLDPRFFAGLADQVERIMKRSPVARALSRSKKTDASNSSAHDRIRRLKVRELFHDDSLCRLAAARWMKDHEYSEAIPTLEGVLSIEEDNEVRREISQTLTALRNSVQEKGEMRC